MTKNELISMKESIQRIERFPIGYPKLITDCDPKWLPYFKLTYEWAFSHAKKISVNNSEEQMRLVV